MINSIEIILAQTNYLEYTDIILRQKKRKKKSAMSNYPNIEKGKNEIDVW